MEQGKACAELLREPSANAAVLVAHPDDETLWAGGLILARPTWRWFIATLCRARDPDRAPKFGRVLEALHAQGAMGNLDDGPTQTPLDPDVVEETLLALLPTTHFDLVLTHGPAGEYTRHRRHEEVCRAVVALWKAGRLTMRALALFAYEDGGRAYLPRPAPDAHYRAPLDPALAQAKDTLITARYSFAPDSWEARTTPHEEALYCFTTASEAEAWIQTKGPAT